MEFHEPIGLEGYSQESVDPVYACDRCQASFDSLRELQLHLFEDHPSTRPTLTLRGVEVGAAVKIVSQTLSLSDITIDHARSARINGNTVALSELPKALSSAKPSTIHILLEGDGTNANFHLRFDYASTADLQGIEHCFFAAAQRGRLDRRSIDDFISACKQFPSAAAYCDGVCEYLFGVLAKERHEESSLAFDDYLNKFNRSSSILAEIDRTLARTIVSLICFHFNHFELASRYSPTSRVGIAGKHMHHWLISHDVPKQLSVVNDLDTALTDRDTETLISSATMPLAQLHELEASLIAIANLGPTEYDKTKAHLLLSNFYRQTDNQQAAIPHAQELLGSPAFREWAQKFLKIGNPSQ